MPLRPFAMILALSAAASLAAETVVTKDGKSFSGKVTVGAHAVTIESPEVKRTLALTLIQRIDLDPDERIEFEKLKRSLPPLDADAHCRLGAWLKVHHQHERAAEYFRKAITIDPDHVDARRELGFERVDGKWVYSPLLHHRMHLDGVGVPSIAFHWKLSRDLHKLGEKAEEERALRRVLQADTEHREAIAMLRPLIAGRVTKNPFRLPFDGRWMVVAGTEGFNHSGYAQMMNAWDFVKVDEQGRAGKGDPRKLESWYAYEAPVYACADGEVYDVRDEFDDHPIGGVGPLKEGNRVLIRHARGERSVIGHLKRGTVAVKVGDKVKRGQLIGRIGNNGHSGRPHIHFAVYDADGISLPITFHHFSIVERDGLKPVEKGQLAPGKIYFNVPADAKMDASGKTTEEGALR